MWASNFFLFILLVLLTVPEHVAVGALAVVTNVPIIVILRVVMKVGVTMVAGGHSYLVYKYVPTHVYKPVVPVVVMEVALGAEDVAAIVLVLVPPSAGLKHR